MSTTIDSLQAAIREGLDRLNLPAWLVERSLANGCGVEASKIPEAQLAERTNNIAQAIIGLFEVREISAQVAKGGEPCNGPGKAGHAVDCAVCTFPTPPFDRLPYRDGVAHFACVAAEGVNSDEPTEPFDAARRRS